MAGGLTQDAGWWWQGMITKLAGCAAGKTFYCSERESKENESGLSENVRGLRKEDFEFRIVRLRTRGAHC